MPLAPTFISRADMVTGKGCPIMHPLPRKKSRDDALRPGAACILLQMAVCHPAPKRPNCKENHVSKVGIKRGRKPDIEVESSCRFSRLLWDKLIVVNAETMDRRVKIEVVFHQARLSWLDVKCTVWPDEKRRLANLDSDLAGCHGANPQLAGFRAPALAAAGLGYNDVKANVWQDRDRLRAGQIGAGEGNI